jgi:hypothetical protein
MSLNHTATATLTLLLFVGCSNPVEIGTTDSSIRFANATTGMINVWIDGRLRVTGLSMNGLSFGLSVPVGDHSIRIGDPPGAITELTVAATLERRRTLVAYPSGSGSAIGPAVAVLEDTSTYVPLSKSKLRVANLAQNAGAIEIRRSQPDFPSGSLIMTPFPFNATSPYLQSDPGVWEVWISAPGSATKTLSTGPIEIPAGQQRTVLLLDSPGGPRFVVVAD